MIWRLRIWHKLTWPIALMTLLLTAGFVVTTHLVQQTLSRDIEQRGDAVLVKQTESFLTTLIAGVADATDARLNLVRESLQHDAALLNSHAVSLNPGSLRSFLDSMVKGSDLIVAAFYQPLDGDTVSTPTDGPEEPFPDVRMLAAAKPGIAGSDSQILWLPPRRSALTTIGGTVVDLVARVVTVDGPGYLGVSLSTGRLARRVNERLPLPGSYFFLIDGQHRLIAAPPHARLELASAEAFKPEGVIDLSRPEVDALATALKRMSGGQSLLETVDIRGNSKYLAYQPLSNASWRIGLVVPVSIATHASEDLVSAVKERTEDAVQTMMLWALVLMGCTLVVTALVTGRLMRPLREVTAVAEGIAAGDLEQRVPVKGDDEIARLGQSFNTMADQLNVLIHNLESRVADRTQEAEAARRRVQNILKSSPVGICFLDASGAIQQVNSAFLELFGCTEHEVIGDDVARFHADPEDRTRVARNAMPKLRAGATYKTVCTLKRKSGHPFISSLQGRAVDPDDMGAGFIWVIQDISEQKRLEKELERQASLDRLTGTYNRWKFERLLEQAIYSAQRYERTFALILFDIDHFKAINDTWGHNVGDEVLVQLAQLVAEQLREVDSLARWGGEEFLILLPETDLEGATQLAERIRSRVETATFSMPGTLTVSLGVACFAGESSSREIVKRADDALYEAKHQGRNRVSVG